VPNKENPVRRSLILLPVVVLTLILLATTSVAARAPIALGVSSETSTDLAAVDAFTQSVGAKPALWTLWSSWGDRAGRGSCSKHQGSCAFPTAVARGLRARGITPFIWWQPTDPTNPDAGVYERYKNIISGKHDQYIRAWAKAAKAFGRPVIVRMFHEMNGDWFPWSVNKFKDNTPERFKSAWRHIVTEFRRVGARNVKFLWSPYLWGKGKYEVLYPGNDYVDYVGVTSLNWGGERWKSLSSLLERPMGAMRKITRTSRNPNGKPVILPEVASNHDTGDKAAWITSGYRAAYKKWPAIRAMVYFDYNTAVITDPTKPHPDWRLVMPPDGSALAAYRSIATQKFFKASIP
jgi:hypothetical protein